MHVFVAQAGGLISFMFQFDWSSKLSFMVEAMLSTFNLRANIMIILQQHDTYMHIG